VLQISDAPDFGTRWISHAARERTWAHSRPRFWASFQMDASTSVTALNSAAGTGLPTSTCL